jgi:hypothetical protein
MKGGAADDDNERLAKSRKFGEFVEVVDLITRRKFVNCLIETILHQVNKGRATSYSLKLVVYLVIPHRIMIQGVESSVDFGIV